MEVLDEVAVHHREAVLVTRDVTDYWIAQYFHRAMQTDPYRTWNATLLQWIRRVSTHPCSTFSACTDALAS